jgi:hypothetical protein
MEILVIVFQDLKEILVQETVNYLNIMKYLKVKVLKFLMLLAKVNVFLIILMSQVMDIAHVN